MFRPHGVAAGVFTGPAGVFTGTVGTGVFAGSAGVPVGSIGVSVGSAGVPVGSSGVPVGSSGVTGSVTTTLHTAFFPLPSCAFAVIFAVPFFNKLTLPFDETFATF